MLRCFRPDLAIESQQPLRGRCCLVDLVIYLSQANCRVAVRWHSTQLEIENHQQIGRALFFERPAKDYWIVCNLIPKVGKICRHMPSILNRLESRRGL